MTDTSKNSGGETSTFTAESMFGNVVCTLGTSVVSQVFTHAKDAWREGDEGVTYPDVEAGVALSVYADTGVNFRIGNHQEPQRLTFERARQLVAAKELMDEASS